MAYEGLYFRRDCSKLAGVNEGSVDSIDCEGDEDGVIGRFGAELQVDKHYVRILFASGRFL
jgi:hypothetical protein